MILRTRPDLVHAMRIPFEGVAEAHQLMYENKHSGKIAILVCYDVEVPELARVVADLRTDLKVLYTSGYAEDAIVEHGIIEPGLAFVPKPFTPKAARTTRCFSPSSGVST